MPAGTTNPGANTYLTGRSRTVTVDIEFSLSASAVFYAQGGFGPTFLFWTDYSACAYLGITPMVGAFSGVRRITGGFTGFVSVGFRINDTYTQTQLAAFTIGDNSYCVIRWGGSGSRTVVERCTELYSPSRTSTFVEAIAPGDTYTDITTLGSYTQDLSYTGDHLWLPADWLDKIPQGAGIQAISTNLIHGTGMGGLFESGWNAPSGPITAGGASVTLTVAVSGSGFDSDNSPAGGTTASTPTLSDKSSADASASFTGYPKSAVTIGATLLRLDGSQDDAADLPAAFRDLSFFWNSDIIGTSAGTRGVGDRVTATGGRAVQTRNVGGWTWSTLSHHTDPSGVTTTTEDSGSSATTYNETGDNGITYLATVNCAAQVGYTSEFVANRTAPVGIYPTGGVSAYWETRFGASFGVLRALWTPQYAYEGGISPFPLGPNLNDSNFGPGWRKIGIAGTGAASSAIRAANALTLGDGGVLRIVTDANPANSGANLIIGRDYTQETAYYSSGVYPYLPHRYVKFRIRSVGSAKQPLTAILPLAAPDRPFTSNQITLSTGDDGQWVERIVDVLETPDRADGSSQDQHSPQVQGWQFTNLAAGATYEIGGIYGANQTDAHWSMITPGVLVSSLDGQNSLAEAFGAYELAFSQSHYADPIRPAPSHTYLRISDWVTLLGQLYPSLIFTRLRPGPSVPGGFSGWPLPLANAFTDLANLSDLGAGGMIRQSGGWQTWLDNGAAAGGSVDIPAQARLGGVKWYPGAGDVMNAGRGGAYGSRTTIEFGVITRAWAYGILVGDADDDGGQIIAANRDTGEVEATGTGASASGYISTKNALPGIRPFAIDPIVAPDYNYTHGITNRHRLSGQNGDGDKGTVSRGISWQGITNLTNVYPNTNLPVPTPQNRGPIVDTYLAPRQGFYFRVFVPPAGGGVLVANLSHPEQGWFGIAYCDPANHRIVFRRTQGAVGAPDDAGDWLPAVIVAGGTSGDSGTRYTWPDLYLEAMGRLRLRWQQTDSSGSNVREAISDDEGATWNDRAADGSSAAVSVAGGMIPRFAKPARNDLPLPTIGAAFVPDSTGASTGTLFGTESAYGASAGAAPTATWTFQYFTGGALVNLPVTKSGYDLAQAHEGAARWILTCYFSGETDPSDWTSADNCRTWTRLPTPAVSP